MVKKRTRERTPAGGGDVATGAVEATGRSAPHSATEINAPPPRGLIRGLNAANHIT